MKVELSKTSTSMTTKRRTRPQESAAGYLEKLMGRSLTFGDALSALGESEGKTLSQFAERLSSTRMHLSDLEHGRRTVSLERAAKFATAFGSKRSTIRAIGSTRPGP